MNQHQAGVDGYYVRIAPPNVGEAASPLEGYVPIRNRPPGQSREPAMHIISPDALALVRFGLRAADDPRIVNTTKVIDRLLKTDTPFDPVWHRYNDDGYGEHEDGSPFDGAGVGLYLADLPTKELSPGTQIQFTFYWPQVDRWEGTDYSLHIVAGD